MTLATCHVTPEVLALLDEATGRGIYIELAGQELHTATSGQLSQADIDEYTARLEDHAAAVAMVIIAFGLAEKGGIH